MQSINSNFITQNGRQIKITTHNHTLLAGENKSEQSPRSMVVRILRFEIRILRCDTKLKEKDSNHVVYLKVPGIPY